MTAPTNETCLACGHDTPHNRRHTDGTPNLCLAYVPPGDPNDDCNWCLCTLDELSIAALRAEKDAEIARLKLVEAENYSILLDEMRHAWRPTPGTFVRFEEIEAFVLAMGAHKVASSLRSDYEKELLRLCDEVDALRPDAKLGAMLVEKAKEVAALAPGLPRIIICDAVAAELVERLSSPEAESAAAPDAPRTDETKEGE